MKYAAIKAVRRITKMTPTTTRVALSNLNFSSVISQSARQSSFSKSSSTTRLCPKSKKEYSISSASACLTGWSKSDGYQIRKPVATLSGWPSLNCQYNLFVYSLSALLSVVDQILAVIEQFCCASYLFLYLVPYASSIRSDFCLNSWYLFSASSPREFARPLGESTTLNDSTPQ